MPPVTRSMVRLGAAALEPAVGGAQPVQPARVRRAHVRRAPRQAGNVGQNLIIIGDQVFNAPGVGPAGVVPPPPVDQPAPGAPAPGAPAPGPAPGPAPAAPAAPEACNTSANKPERNDNLRN